MASAVTPQRFASGMTFDEYVAYAGTPENLAREAGWWLGTERRDLSGLLRTWYEQRRISDAQGEAIRWLARQPDGPARILVISEEWSSDCRRDVPMLARLADAGPRAARGPCGVAQRRHRERVPAGAGRPDLPVRARRRLLHARLPVPVSLHRDAGPLSQGAPLHCHAAAATRRDEPGDVGPLHAGLGRPPAG